MSYSAVVYGPKADGFIITRRIIMKKMRWKHGYISVSFDSLRTDSARHVSS